MKRLPIILFLSFILIGLFFIFPKITPHAFAQSQGSVYCTFNPIDEPSPGLGTCDPGTNLCTDIYVNTYPPPANWDELCEAYDDNPTACESSSTNFPCECGDLGEYCCPGEDLCNDPYQPSDENPGDPTVGCLCEEASCGYIGQECCGHASDPFCYEGSTSSQSGDCTCIATCNSSGTYGDCVPGSYVRCESNLGICCPSQAMCPESPLEHCIFKQPLLACPNDHPYHCYLFFCCDNQTYCPLSEENRRGLCDGDRGIDTALGCFNISTPEDFIESLFEVGISIAGGLALLLIIAGVFQVMTSRGDPKKVQAGKELITAAIAGLLLIIFSIFILRAIGGNILRLPAYPVEETDCDACMICVGDPDTGITCSCDATLPGCEDCCD